MKLLDNSSLSFFIIDIPQFNCIVNLYNICESLNTSFAVKEEFDVNNVSDLDKYICENIIFVQDIDYETLKHRYPNLGKGELSIMQWGLNLSELNKPYCCILDDKKARKIANELNLNITGSIGLIFKLKKQGIYNDSQIEGIIHSIKDSKFRVGNSILNMLRE